jgi:hypothetical protein
MHFRPLPAIPILEPWEEECFYLGILIFYFHLLKENPGKKIKIQGGTKLTNRNDPVPDLCGHMEFLKIEF